jgi:hypothetical protein
MKTLRRVVGWWFDGWQKFVEASRGLSTGGMAGPNPWGDVPQRQNPQARDG